MKHLFSENCPFFTFSSFTKIAKKTSNKKKLSQNSRRENVLSRKTPTEGKERNPKKYTRKMLALRVQLQLVWTTTERVEKNSTAKRKRKSENCHMKNVNSLGKGSANFPINWSWKRLQMLSSSLDVRASPTASDSLQIHTDSEIKSWEAQKRFWKKREKNIFWSIEA